MVGGSNYRESQFNLAVQGERQPGSAFKPFVLATALKEGISPATRFVSQPTVIPLGDKLWQVNNYEGEYLGSVDLETATVHSDNSVYAQVGTQVGTQKIKRLPPMRLRSRRRAVSRPQPCSRGSKWKSRTSHPAG